MNKYVILFISIFMIVVGFTVQRAIVDRNPQVVNSVTTNSEGMLVLSDKVWKVEFTKEMDKATITSDNIYVKDSNGDKLNLKVELSENKKTIFIYPPTDGYDPNMKSYTLHVESDIKATNGNTIKSDKRIEFTATKDLPVIESKEQLTAYFQGLIKSQKQLERTIKSDGIMEESSSAGDMAGAEKSSAGANEFTDTNVQVQGVDEADIVKTDGTYIYQAIDGKLKITKVVPSTNIETVATIPFKDFQPFQLYIDDNKLVVMGHSYTEFQEPVNPNSSASHKMIMPMNQQTKILVFDVTDKNHPKEIKSVEIEGNYMTSRKIGSKVYVINHHYPDYWIMEQRKDIDLRPRYKDSSSTDEPKYVEFKDIRYFPESKQASFSIIASFDINEPEKEATITTYLGSGQEVYMTKDSLYITVTRYEYQENNNKREIHVPIEDTDIYKFAINDLQVEFLATGTVPGRLLNQFSMDEHEGYFRIATTKGDTWDEKQPSANHLFVLDSKLGQVGSVEDLARGERIYSVRFMGDKAYIVTFKETDPLFVLDVSNPRKPTVLGELKIPGFSNYLHPYDEKHLIGFGQNTKVIKDKGASQPRIMTDGVKISLFDVTDPLNPKEKFTEVIGGSGTYSPLNHDHKALLFNKKKNIFAFPITIYEDKQGSEYEQLFKFQGIYGYSIDLEKGFQLQQKITHEHEGVQYENWENQIMRVLNIEDELFAVSPKRITAHKWE
ncbi:beta-propeller domain-containing protein [Bacillus suaedaesalsae]|uniref:Beta-propeller domain-containing protein n=1 Tax=Bacillus suaedaesalsae TaxID=2810349 RepID=A0ABS2DKA3_9BACI|nr:beta-propeller domain-containing protein [Bacillus suaedaesalsae]MBM6618899.1 beta-propeller domain-containing protein [Bacillus suaedaesalsae]